MSPPAVCCRFCHPHLPESRAGGVGGCGPGSEVRILLGRRGCEPGSAFEVCRAAHDGVALRDVYRFIAPLFDCLDLGFIEVKGHPEPVRVYQVTGRRAEPGSLRGVVGLSSPMVGRDQELERLMRLCETVRAGLGRAVLVMGEPGMGKSRLIAEWQASVVSRSAGPAVQWAEAHSHSYAHGLVYHLAAHLAYSLLGTEEGR